MPGAARSKASAAAANVPAGFRVEPQTGALLTLPWDEHTPAIPSLAPWAVAWAETNLIHHITGAPWRFTRDQRRFLHLWYALDEAGRWLYRSGVFRRSKGAGKDPFAAAYLLTELLGPVRFGGWASPGVPISVRHGAALVQIAANSEAQARDVLSVCNQLLPRRTIAKYKMDLGQLRTLAEGGRRLEILTSSQKSSEGDPATAILLNETHHMTHSSGGEALAEVARRNVGKSPYGLARVLEMTNAHEPGAKSVAESSWDAFQAQVAGKTRNKRLLYDSREWALGTKLDNERSLMRGLAQAYADAPWVDLPTIRDEIWDPRTAPNLSRRFYGNQIAKSEDAWADPQLIRAATRTDRPFNPGDEIVLFGDGSKNDDATGLVGVRLSDGHAQVLHVQQPKKGELVDREAFDAAVTEAFATYVVRAFWFDPSHTKDADATGPENRFWHPICDEWAVRYGRKINRALWAERGKTTHPILYDMAKQQSVAQFVPATEQALADINRGVLTHDGSAWLIEHLTNARERKGRFGTGISKSHREATKKIDLAVCLIGARMLWRLATLQAATGKKAGGRTPGAGRVVVLD